ncbi:hypothetical protein JHK82_027068 [Glycine max]|nr:hypothetical protein JHK85_027691 [Glycine max]KAG5003056.1 hypothetical protein JHK86_027195 [Glycine max]KAG5126233.1 hypothetical protein JHK82_027068 [Glycine max]
MLSANLLFSDMYRGRRLSDRLPKCHHFARVLLVLEFLRTDLATIIVDATKANQPFPADELKRWMIQILSGLDTYHRHMVLHHDLKPSNLLISELDLLKITNFGQIISFSTITKP